MREPAELTNGVITEPPADVCNLVLQSQFGTLPLVMAATSGGLMTASPH
jgi:hypothetical protein